jgi:hypothetical protein
LLKRVPQSPDLASALQTDADAEEPATEPLPAPMSRLDAIIADPEPDRPNPDPTTGEIIDTKPAPDADSPAAKEAASGAAGADNASADPARKPVPHIAVPAADASVKVWGNYRGQLIETIKTAPDAAWLAEFQERNQDGLAVLDSEFPPAAKLVRDAIKETLAGLNGGGK